MLFRIQEVENGNFTKDDKFYELQSCTEFLPTQGKTISDYGWIEYETEELAVEGFGLTRVEIEE